MYKVKINLLKKKLIFFTNKIKVEQKKKLKRGILKILCLYVYISRVGETAGRDCLRGHN